MLLKRTVVARLHENQQSQRHVYFQYDRDESEAREGVYITRKTWAEFNMPAVITVTIEAGDKLLEEETQERNLLDKVPSRLPHVPLTVRT